MNTPMRIEALKLAIQASPENPLPRAEEFYRFLTDDGAVQKKPQGRGSAETALRGADGDNRIQQ